MRILGSTIETMFLEAVAECLATNPENSCGLTDITVGLLEGRLDSLPLDFPQRFVAGFSTSPYRCGQFTWLRCDCGTH